MRAIIYGILASFFFAFTFIINRLMELSGGYWIWSASIRYFIMIPILLLIVLRRKNLAGLMNSMRQKPLSWIIWSTVGFGLFYAPFCFAAAYGPGWLLAGTWQITIIAGALLTPLFYVRVETSDGSMKVRGRIPLIGLLMSFIIIIGIVLMQLQHATQISTKEIWLGIIPVLTAAFAYPLGNRKMMEVCEGQIDAYQRVLGMTIASLPFWLLLSVVGLIQVGPPKGEQVLQSAMVAITSGLIATVLFFKATDLVNGDVRKLAAIEATQAGEVIFALFGEMIFLHAPIPPMVSITGMSLVIIGMILHSYVVVIKKREHVRGYSIDSST